MQFPSVTAVMLTANRPDLARRAVENFRAQTYPNRRLLIYDTGRAHGGDLVKQILGHTDSSLHFAPVTATVGGLRNLANENVTSDILCHWDDDDWSHPNRIAEQVELLQASGADCVGYNEMLFWREEKWVNVASPFYNVDEPERNRQPGEAWLYSQPNPRSALGTSLCYWRKAWERTPFPALNNGEDTAWLQQVRCGATTSLPIRPEDLQPGVKPNIFNTWPKMHYPRMIARIHAGNAGNAGNAAYKPEVMAACEKQGDSWKRVPHWDDHCRGIFEVDPVGRR